MHTIDIDGVTIAFDDHAPSRPRTLLLVHGHPFNRSMWEPQAHAAAAHGWRVVVPDLRGYGGSAATPGTVPLSTFARDLAALLDALGVASAVVGGLSMGGQIAMEFCRQAPGRTSGLLLAATFPQAETPEGRARRLATAERLIAEGMDPYAREVLPKMVGARCLRERREVGDRVLAMMRATNPQGAAAALRGRADRPPYEPVLAAFRGPATIVVGDEDAFTTRADADAMRTLLRDAELLRLPGVGHMPNLERPEDFNAALLRLLDRAHHAA